MRLDTCEWTNEWQWYGDYANDKIEKREKSGFTFTTTKALVTYRNRPVMAVRAWPVPCADESSSIYAFVLDRSVTRRRIWNIIPMETIPRTCQWFVFHWSLKSRSRSWTAEASRQKGPRRSDVFGKKTIPPPSPGSLCENPGNAADLVLVHSFQMVFQVVELVLGDRGMFGGRAVHREMPQHVPDDRDGTASVEHQRPVVVGDFEQVPGRALGDDRADHVACGPTGTIKPKNSKTACFSRSQNRFLIFRKYSPYVTRREMVDRRPSSPPHPAPHHPVHTRTYPKRDGSEKNNARCHYIFRTFFPGYFRTFIWWYDRCVQIESLPKKHDFQI